MLQDWPTVIDYLFAGVILDHMQCQHCSEVSTIYHTVFDLSLEVGADIMWW